MPSGLPSLPNPDKIRKHTETKFGGYNHNLSAQDGEIWDMQNLSSDLYPLLSPRKPRYLLQTLTKPNGFYARDGVYYVDGTSFFADGAVRGTVSDSRKQFASLGAYIIILPDKKYYNRLDGSFGDLEVSWSGSVSIQDGSYVGEAAEANSIYAANAQWPFRAGDAINISGCTTHGENNKTAIIREVDGDYLRFYENSFVISDGGDVETVTLKREIPEMDFICENENRLWGCKGDTIYASKLGDIFNWNVFDGLATDSYAVDVGSAGDFTACFSYLGYPCFFKEESIYKVYGSKPSNYQVMGSASLGVEKGSGQSLAIAGETLFYLSRTGIVAYSGGIPQSVAAAFGTERYRNAVAGSDGNKYYVSMQNSAGDWNLFVFDTQRKLWHREDALEVVGWGWDGELHFLDGSGKLWLNGNTRSIPPGATAENAVSSWAEFGDFIEASPNKKGTGKIQLRMELDTGATVQVWLKFDSTGNWTEVATLSAAAKRSYYLPIIPRRNDHFRIKLIGSGSWRLYSLVRESYHGSEL